MQLTLMRDLQKNESVRIVPFSGTGLSTSSSQVTDEESNLINYPCEGLEIHNSHASYVLEYSFDNSTFYKVFPLGTREDEQHFNALYVKLSSGSAGTYQGKVAKHQ